MAFLFPPRWACKVCCRDFDERADGQLRAHFVHTATGKKRCPGGGVPEMDAYALASQDEIPKPDESCLPETWTGEPVPYTKEDA